MGLFNKKPKKEEKKCTHTIGENESIEVYIWKGKSSQPYKHWVQFQCEECGKSCITIKDDSLVKSYKEYGGALIMRA